MALTLEQKEAGKVARRDRGQAWRARRKLREAAEAEGLRLIALEHEPHLSAAIRVEDDLFDRERQKLKAIDDQIAALQAARAAILEDRTELNEARKARDAAYSEKRKAEKALQERLDREFPDLIGAAQWSAAAWASAKVGGA